MRKILVLDDNLGHAKVVAEVLGKEGLMVRLATTVNEASRILDEDQEIALVVSDLKLQSRVDGIEFMTASKEKYPNLEFIIITGHATVENAVEAMSRGAYHYLTKPINLDELRLVVKRAMEKQEIILQNIELRKYIDEKYGVENIIGQSEGIRRVLEKIKQVAPTSASVLITGESGTGKELVAKSIHHNSPRRNKPFVALNCAAISEGILESELFGHEKGAFTGALQRRTGKFEAANGGTIFLDEVGDMPVSTQVKLLRVLEERVIERVGGNNVIPVDVRLLAATNQKLEGLVEEGKFREDLYFRLKVITLELPPLRSRPRDIPLLVDHFIREFSKQHHKNVRGISKQAMDILCHYNWPGNVRQLRNVIENMVVLTPGEIILPDTIPPEIHSDSLSKARLSIGSFIGMKLEDVEKLLIGEILKETGGNKREAAEILGISERTLYRKIREMERGGGAVDEQSGKK